MAVAVACWRNVIFANTQLLNYAIEENTTHLYFMIPSKTPIITQLIGGAAVCSCLTGKVDLCLCQFVL